MFLVFQTMLNLHLLFVNITNFLVRLFVYFPFDSENGSRRIISFRSSNNHSEIVQSFLQSLKYSIVFLIKLLGKQANKNLLVMRFTSILQLSAILLALCNSFVMYYIYVQLEFLKTNALEAFQNCYKFLLLFHTHFEKLRKVYHEKFRNFNIFYQSQYQSYNSLVFVFLFDMANTILFNC